MRIVESFATRLQTARKKAGFSQDELARRLNLTRGVIANYESGLSAPDPVRAVQMARILNARSTEFLLLSIVQRSAPGPEQDASGPDDDGFERLESVVAELLGLRGPEPDHDALDQPLTLSDFPHRFSPLVVVVGDRRETEPTTIGDLGAFSASPVDDRWLPALELPKGTEKVSDKVFVTAPAEWLKEQFGKKHILSIGSPAANLFTRKYNDHFVFRFATTREALGMVKAQAERTQRDMSRAALLRYSEEMRSHLRQTMRLFKQPGFLDFTYQHLKVGIDPATNRDFAVISIGRNPFSAPHDRFFSVLAAGVHHPGTAHAVKFLSNHHEFENHPFGGVLEVQVPSDAEPPDVQWYEKIAKSEAHWHEAGGGKDRPYTASELRMRIETIQQKAAGNLLIADFEIKDEELQGHLNLIDKLVGGASKRN